MTVDDIKAQLTAASDKRHQAEVNADADQWIAATLETDRLLDLLLSSA